MKSSLVQAFVDMPYASRRSRRVLGVSEQGQREHWESDAMSINGVASSAVGPTTAPARSFTVLQPLGRLAVRHPGTDDRGVGSRGRGGLRRRAGAVFVDDVGHGGR